MPDGERHFAAALDLADACEAPFERALTLVSLAEARQAAGASGVEALIDEARAIATPLRANRLLSRLDAIGSERTARAAVASSPEGLTRREIEVLRLLAEHRTDKEIAEALFISPHTASTHVKHLLAKLGVASRREAPARAARLIPPEPTT
jgi:DNA-binding CsgD family transcriptional regulator